MPKKATKAISSVTIKGRKFWRLTYPTAEGRKREHFSTEAAAKARLRDVVADAKRFGESAAGMSPELRADAIAAARELSGTGKTLLDAARALRAQIDHEQSGVAISKAVADFLASKESKASDKYFDALKARLEHFSAYFEGRTTAQLTPGDVDTFLSGLPGSERTRLHYRTHISGLAKFCRKHGHAILPNLMADVDAIKPADAEPQTISAADAAALLAACDAEILPGVVLGLFCGIRQAEIERLSWEAVSFEERHVEIGATIAKTRSRRIVPIPPNAVAWLAPYRKRTGKLWPTGARNRFNLARIRAGFGPFFSTSAEVKRAQEEKTLKPWPDNCLRHTAISCKVATKPDLARIAYESGNSPDIIKEHYLALMGKREAAKFAAIKPTSAANVVSFLKSA